MKRQSIAEITLNKQIREINARISILWDEKHDLDSRINVLQQVKQDMESETDKLQQARLVASTRNKPND